ncbi:MAG: hypothetical protein ACJAS9_000382 [Polaribacter sp.]|jgi:hypothetical protein
MSIQPINSEQQSSIRETTNNQFANTQLIQNRLTPEIKALIEQYANQPLLLEKLLLQKNNDALVSFKLAHLNINDRQLSNSSDIPNNLIQLKLPSLIHALKQPIELNNIIEQLKVADKITINVGNNQQVIIKIASLLPQTTLQINFSNIELSPSGNLLLSQAKLINSSLLDTSLVNTNLLAQTKTNLIKTVELNNNIGKIAESLIASPTNTKNNLVIDFTQFESNNYQLKDKISILVNSLATIKNAIKQTENIAIKNNISIDAKTLESTKSSLNTTLLALNKFSIQIGKLFDNINKPIELTNITQVNTSENTKNLVSRLITSGNLFENALKQQVVKNEFNPLYHSSKIPSDNKLSFNKILSQLEKLLVEINHYSEKPVNASQIEKIQKSLLIQLKNITPLEKHQIETNKMAALQKIQVQQEQIQNLISLTKSFQTTITTSLHQIEQNQLHSLKSEQANLQQFLVDLPIKQNGLIDSFEMRFESQSKNNQSVKSKYWKVVVRFDLKPLGPMFAEIQFENERVSTHIFAEKKETAQLINQHLPTLKRSLFSAGVDVSKVSGSQGNIPDNLKDKESPNIDAHV